MSLRFLRYDDSRKAGPFQPPKVGCAHTHFASRLLHDAFFGRRALECFLVTTTALRVYPVAFGQRALRDSWQVGCAHTRLASRLLHGAFFGRWALECFLGAMTALRVYPVAFGRWALRDGRQVGLRYSFKPG